MSAILLPERRADPTRARTLVRARPGDVAIEARRAEYAAEAAAMLRRAQARYPFATGMQAGNQTNQWVEPVFANSVDGPQVVSAAAETALLNLTTTGQPWFYPGFFGAYSGAAKWVDIEATGVLQTTGTPTYTWFVRLGSTQNVITGTIIAQSAGITTASGAGAGTYWELRCRILLKTPAIGSGNATITSSGTISSPSGFASPFIYSMEVSTPPNATWTTTLDGSANQYLMLSVNPGTSNASNNITLKSLRVWATTL